jgi:hypothetical protein
MPPLTERDRAECACIEIALYHTSESVVPMKQTSRRSDWLERFACASRALLRIRRWQRNIWASPRGD